MNYLFLGLGLYLLVQLLIGFVITRHVLSSTDYFVANRRLGYVLTVFGIFATWFGAESVVATTGEVYRKGLSGATADPFGYVIAFFLMGALFARTLWQRNIVTLADLFRERFSPMIEKVAVLLMVPTSVAWAAAQLRAFGHVLSVTGNIELDTAITIAGCVIVIYSSAGGMLADAVHDVIQGTVLIIGLVSLLVMILGLPGEGTTLGRELSVASMTTPRSGRQSWLDTLELLTLVICSSVVAQELVSRIVSSRSQAVAQRSFFIAGSLYGVIGLIPITIGIVAPKIIPGLPDPEQALSIIAKQYLPPIGYVLFSGALISAILSTTDCTLLAGGSVLARNVFVLHESSFSGKQQLLLSRALVGGLGCLAYIIALHTESIFQLVKDGTAIGSTGLLVAMLTALHTRHIPNQYAALGALLTGISSWCILQYVLHYSYPYLLSLALSASMYAIVYMIGHYQSQRKSL